jgi:hypothetical protein
LHCAYDKLAVGHFVKLSRRHNHAAKLKRENKSEKQFFAASVSPRQPTQQTTGKMPVRPTAKIAVLRTVNE